MDFKSLVNKESFRAILHHHLKNQIWAKFGSSVSKSIQTQCENEPFSADSIIASVSSNISQSEDYKDFLKTFLNNLNHLFEDKEKYIPKEDNNLGTISQCSSASSINASPIDYLSFDQFQDIIYTLSNGINAEKLEALETFSRLPSLEHIIKRTLWPAVESGLHDALQSNVPFLKDASLRVYTKMLSSSEPKVVQESFNSLIKYLVQNLLPYMNQNGVDFTSKCKCTVEIIAILNKFLQNIPNHWLRYPQQVIEDITVQSISILSFGSKNPAVFPVWLCVALCDKKSKWLKNMLYGYVSRAFLLDTLQKDPYIIKFIVEFCQNFNLNDNQVPWINRCCQSFAEVSEITHIICFLSHLLQYSQGREMFGSLDAEEESFTWLDILDIIMKCSQKLCLVSCLNCCATVCQVVPKLWHHIWSSTNISLYSDALINMLFYFYDIENMSINCIQFIIQCLSHMSFNFTHLCCSQENEYMAIDFICMLLKYLTNFSFDFSDITPEALVLLNSSLQFIRKILSDPSNLFINLTFIQVFFPWCLKFSNISKSLVSSFSPGMKSCLVSETEQNISRVFISMLQKPNSISVLHDIELFETSINILLEKILDDIKTKDIVCPRDVSILATALNSTFSVKPVLNKSIIFKISSVIWQFDSTDFENLSKVKCMLEIVIPSIFPYIFENEILFDTVGESDNILFQSVILFPSLTNQEFIMLEEFNILALEMISLLTCSVINSCYLEAKYKLSDLLFELQYQHVNEDGNTIIDPVSVIQNHLLVKLYTVGGPSEKTLPPETLLRNDEVYNWPFFMNCPVPEIYYHKLPHDGAMEIGGSPFELNNENLKDIFLEYIKLNLLTIDVVSQILKVSVNDLEPSSALSRTLNFVTLDDVCDIVLQDEVLVGLEMTKRYGSILNLMIDDSDKKLERLLKAGKCLLSTESRLQFDIFISTVCLIFKCDIQTSWLFLETFSKSPSSLFIWYERILQAIEQNGKYITVFNIIMEHCDIIVKTTLPLIYSAFQFSRVLPSALFKHWTMQCYWNYLDFNEITYYILISIIFGGDFAIYFFVSILKHIQNIILKNAHNINLINLLKRNTIEGYKMQNYMFFIRELANIFHSKISKSISDILEE